MATDQGKLSNINGLMIAAEALGKAPPKVGLTTFRPPYTPTTFGTFAGYHRGAHFEVTRKTPIDGWAEEHGAVWEPVGQWRRARYFPQAGEGMDEAVARECRAARETVGIFDASTLGKIEVTGPDAAEFMNRMYTNPWTKLETRPLPLWPPAGRGRVRARRRRGRPDSGRTASTSPPPPAAPRGCST